MRILIEEQAGLAVLQVADPSETLHQGGGGGSEFSKDDHTKIKNKNKFCKTKIVTQKISKS